MDVCEQYTAITSTDIGWKCKDSSTMAYQLDNGTYVSDVGCVLGCTTNSCVVPTLFSANTTNKIESRQNVDIAFDIVLAMIVQTLIIYVIGQSIMFGKTVVSKMQSDYSFWDWPEFDSFDDKLHYDWVAHQQDFMNTFNNPYLTETQFRDICRETLNNPDVLNINKYEQIASADYKNMLVSYDKTTKVVAMGTKDGRIFYCFIMNPGSVSRKVESKQWLPIPIFPEFYAFDAVIPING